MGMWQSFVACIISFFFWSSAYGLSPDRVVVVANSADKDSVAIAEHYVEKRGIPKENLILLETPTKETITWDEFVDTLFNPLRTALYKDGWIEGSLSDTKDSEGRLKLASLGGRLDFLVLCRLPLRIQNDKARLEAAPNLPPQKQFQVNQGSVDGELALLALQETPTVGFIPNPLYNQKNPPSLMLQQVIKVARLDGPSRKAAMNLVDSAMEAEAKGLRGRAYIDLGGPHQKGDDWMQLTGEQLESMDYPATWNRDKAAIGFDERFDAPAFYFGWWKLDITGPPRERDFQFPPGAIGWHLHSYSANSVRRNNFRWTGPLVERGLAATVGNVYEPYLELTHYPHMFVEALRNGMSVGDAAYYSLPALSWMAIFVGDPLYQPFKVNLEEQLEQMKEAERPDALSQYVVIREMNRLDHAQNEKVALAYGQQQFHYAPGLALGYALAEREATAGDIPEAIDAVKFASKLPPIFNANEQGLVFKTSELLWKLDDHDDAFKLMRSLMNSALPEPAQRAYLPTAINQASTEGNSSLLSEWLKMQREFDEKDRAAEEAKQAAKKK